MTHEDFIRLLELDGDCISLKEAINELLGITLRRSLANGVKDEGDELVTIRLSTDKSIKPMDMSIDIPKSMTDEEYLDSIDISNELRLMHGVSIFGSYKSYKAVQKRTVEFMSELAKKSEN